MSAQSRLLVTGASGQLGQLVLDQLLTLVPAERIVGLVRSAEVGRRLTDRGIETRLGDYDQPETLDVALSGIDRVLLISSNAIGRRGPQHGNVIAAAKRVGVKLLAYTSLLHADTSPLGLAAEHLATEALLRASGVPFVLLRNGWYNENYTASIAPALAHNALFGCAGAGRIASAARVDYAAAAAAVLTTPEDLSGRVFELAGDGSYTLAELAADIAQQSGKAVGYVDLPEAQYQAALVGAGLPEPLAAMLADSDAGAAKGGLFDDGRQLSTLIGRPTTPMTVSVAAALKAL